MTYIVKKITIYKKILFELSLSGRRVENLKLSSQIISQKSLVTKLRNTESSLARNMEKNLPNINRKTSKISEEKKSWRSENCQINYNIRTPKASFGLKMRLTKSTKTGLFQIITDFPKNITE